MSTGNIYVTIIRTGKNEVTETVRQGATPREVFEQAGVASSVYSSWAIQDEDGNTLSLDTPINSSTALVCGARVDGAA